jgi:Spy/CpxP family protein refolding chaperone
MKNKMLTYGLATALLLGAGFTAWAGNDGSHRHGRRGAFLTRVLDLNADQQAAVEKLHQELVAKAEPLRDQRRQQRKEVAALLETANPDPAAVGQKVIAAQTTKQQMKALHDEFESRLSALLNPEQQEKFQKLQARREEGRSGRFERGHRGMRHRGSEI